MMGSCCRYTSQKTWKLQMFETEFGPISWGWSLKKCSTSRKNLVLGGLKLRSIWSIKTTTSPFLGSGRVSLPETLQWMTSFLAKTLVWTYYFKSSSMTRETTQLQADSLDHLQNQSPKKRKHYRHKIMLLNQTIDLRVKCYEQLTD